MERRRVAAVTVRDGRVLMVRERRRRPAGRHDGAEYWVLPGGGIEPGEAPEEAVARDVREEVGLACLAVRHVFDAIYPSGRTCAGSRGHPLSPQRRGPVIIPGRPAA